MSPCLSLCQWSKRTHPQLVTWCRVVMRPSCPMHGKSYTFGLLADWCTTSSWLFLTLATKHRRHIYDFRHRNYLLWLRKRQVMQTPVSSCGWASFPVTKRSVRALGVTAKGWEFGNENRLQWCNIISLVIRISSVLWCKHCLHFYDPDWSRNEREKLCPSCWPRT